MSRLRAVSSVLLLLICTGSKATEALDEGVRRALQQTTGATTVDAPSGTEHLHDLYGLGTQNYTSLQNGTYLNTGAVADLYKNATKTGLHFFDAAGKPTWVIFDPWTGEVQGIVHASVKARAPTQKQQNDGGFGSVDSLLLTASQGSGVLAKCTYIQRLNVLGGKLPAGFYGLPAYATSIPNFPAAIPYQADYIFLSTAEPNGKSDAEGPSSNKHN